MTCSCTSVGEDRLVWGKVDFCHARQTSVGNVCVDFTGNEGKCRFLQGMQASVDFSR